VLTEIGEEFVRLRTESRAGAWSQLQAKLNANLGLLVPAATSMKDFFALSMDIEAFLKTEQGSESLHPTEALERWLNEGATIAPTIDTEDDDVPEGRVQ
jgi:hypothetical protein